MVTILHDEADARKTARAFASSLPRGSLVLLEGPLGAGKTTFVQAMIEAVGGPSHASSPTYGLVHEIPTAEGTVVHADAYRLGDARELLDLGLEEYVDRARFVAVEWGGPLADTFPEAYHVVLERHADGTRRLVVRAPGELPLGDREPRQEREA